MAQQKLLYQNANTVSTCRPLACRSRTHFLQGFQQYIIIYLAKLVYLVYYVVGYWTALLEILYYRGPELASQLVLQMESKRDGFMIKYAAGIMILQD